MKRIWIGVGLLVALVIVGLWNAKAMHDAHTPGAADLRMASRMALDGDWAESQELAHQAKETWEKKWRVTAAFADHEPMDQIDCAFAQLEVYAQARSTTDYAAACAGLAEQLEAMGQAHVLNWWNLM